MSERQAKLNRKSAQSENKKPHKRDRRSIIVTVIAVVLIAGVAGVGGYASWDKIRSSAPAQTEESQTAQQQTQTVADVAEEKGITADELLAKVGMDGDLTADSDASDFYSKLTIETYAKFEDKSADDIKKEYGIESLSDDTLWQEAQMQVPMSKVAEQSGKSFADFASENGLPEEITEKTTYEDAIKIMQTQAAQQNAEDADSSDNSDSNADSTNE